MKEISVENVIEIAMTDDAWLIKRVGDNGEFITTVMKKDEGEEDSQEHISAVKDLVSEVLSEFLTLRRKYAKNWLEIKQLKRNSIDEEFVEVK